MFKIKRLFKSFGYAFSGLAKVWREERNFRIHAVIALLVLSLAFYWQIAVWQLAVLILIVALILILEIINTIFERLLDLLKPRIHQYVKDIKDMTAAAVLVGAWAAVLLGILIFLPYLVKALVKQ